jgi:hypothetical protein
VIMGNYIILLYCGCVSSICSRFLKMSFSIFGLEIATLLS